MVSIWKAITLLPSKKGVNKLDVCRKYLQGYKVAFFRKWGCIWVNVILGVGWGGGEQKYRAHWVSLGRSDALFLFGRTLLKHHWKSWKSWHWTFWFHIYLFSYRSLMYKNDVNYFWRTFSILIAVTTFRSLNSGCLETWEVNMLTFIVAWWVAFVWM